MANEKRLIRLKDAKEALTGWETDPTDEEIEYVLDELPTVDAVCVVRCKDCKHFDRLFKGEGVVNKIGTCHLRDDEGIETAQSCDDFCSYGERRNNAPEKPV